ncbi:hypothetical protein BC833DRAFT_578796 [Globomyces pollinis-pini]|nr:hypothetical protein BC833DRAFT_578796 [Globomyces pollinis-pini]
MTTKKQIKIWVDGCFDTMHYGHANALRQAKEMGDYLVVGVHSDKEIELNKGPTVLKNNERYAAVAACKWVDEVVEDAPYLTSIEYLDKYNCDFCVHGDDVTTLADGTDCYSVVKNAGRYKECKRTEGVSTTDLVKRMLLRKSQPKGSKAVADDAYTTERLKLFANNKPPKEGDRIVYVDGSFDMFHAGHANFLAKVKEEGTFVIVGVHGDDTLEKADSRYPILNVQERALSVLACRYVDDIILDSPLVIDQSFIDKHKIDIVCNAVLENADRYKAAIETGKYKFIPNQLENISSESVIDRIVKDYEL